MIQRLRSLSLCVLLAAVVAVNGRADSTQPPKNVVLDPSGYLAELDRCSVAAARLKDHPSEATALKNSLPESWSVAADGQKFEVSTDWLRQKLDALPSNPAQASDLLQQILTRLQVMRASAGALAGREGGQSANAAADRQHLDAILQRREFRQAAVARGPLQSWWDRAVSWVEDELDRLFGAIGRHTGRGSPLFWILATGLGVALLGWLGTAIFRAARAPARVVPPGAAIPAAWHEWAAKAAACARRSEFRDAIHLAYRAALYRLEDAGLWQVDDTRTPREYLRLVRYDDRQYASLRALTFRFERSWYGGEAPSADEFQRAVAELKDLGCQFDWNPATANS